MTRAHQLRLLTAAVCNIARASIILGPSLKVRAFGHQDFGAFRGAEIRDDVQKCLIIMKALADRAAFVQLAREFLGIIVTERFDARIVALLKPFSPRHASRLPRQCQHVRHKLKGPLQNSEPVPICDRLR